MSNLRDCRRNCARIAKSGAQVQKCIKCHKYPFKFTVRELPIEARATA